MGPFPQPKHLFPLLILALAVLASSLAYTVQAEPVVPLEYQNSQKEMGPGYKLEIQMYAQAAKWITGYSFSPAAIKIGDVELGFEAEPPGWGGLGTIKVYWFVKDDGKYVDRVKVGEVGFNTKQQYDAAVTLRWECNTETMSIYAETPVGAKTYTVTPGQPPVDVWYYSEKQDPTLGPATESSVMIGDVEKIGNCGSYDVPNPGEGSHGAKLEKDNTKLVAYALLGAGALGLGFYMLNSRGGKR